MILLVPANGATGHRCPLGMEGICILPGARIALVHACDVMRNLCLLAMLWGVCSSFFPPQILHSHEPSNPRRQTTPERTVNAEKKKEKRSRDGQVAAAPSSFARVADQKRVHASPRAAPLEILELQLSLGLVQSLHSGAGVMHGLQSCYPTGCSHKTVVQVE